MVHKCKYVLKKPLKRYFQVQTHNSLQKLFVFAKTIFQEKKICTAPSRIFHYYCYQV